MFRKVVDFFAFENDTRHKCDDILNKYSWSIFFCNLSHHWTGHSEGYWQQAVVRTEIVQTE